MRDQEPEIVARLSASAPRRWFALGVFWVLGLLLLWLAIAEPLGPISQLVLAGSAAAVLFGADRLRRATLGEIRLTEDGLVTDQGVELARMEQILRVERGVFAFKPSSGFLLVLKSRHPRVWRPGLWWRGGRRLGIGGVTNSQAARYMAEKIALQLEAQKRPD